jgi:hypothetical protein
MIEFLGKLLLKISKSQAPTIMKPKIETASMPSFNVMGKATSQCDTPPCLT